MSEKYDNSDRLHDDIAFIEAKVERLESLASLMDSQFEIPGSGIKLGLDTLIGLIPGIGDTIGLGVSSYIIIQALRLGLPKQKLPRMIFNVLIDWAIGLIPIFGDFFDMGWRANNRNAAITRAHWELMRMQLLSREMIDITPRDSEEKLS